MGERPIVPALVDTAALVVFVLAGMRSHDIGAASEIVLRNAIPLLGTWAAVALVVGTYRAPVRTSRLIITWAIAVPVGLLLRSWWVGSPRGGRLLVFLGVGLAFTLLFLLAGRGILTLVMRRRSRGAQ